ncbi:MAG: hypothetical protein OEU46_04055 [Alphaproteobacteria bacterium]|nr:hypothetical protein [Alphaproteobacteria bacterium]
MKVSTRDIDAAFGSDAVPSLGEFVDFDGFDELDKEYAVREFLGKSQDEFYQNIKTGTFGSISAIESWAVLKHSALIFYMAPYLKYIAYDIDDDPNEDETVHFFFYYFNEYIRIYGPIPLDRRQCEVLLALIEGLLRHVQGAQPSSSESPEWQLELIEDLKKLEGSLRSFDNC